MEPLLPGKQSRMPSSARYPLKVYEATLARKPLESTKISHIPVSLTISVKKLLEITLLVQDLLNRI